MSDTIQITIEEWDIIADAMEDAIDCTLQEESWNKPKAARLKKWRETVLGTLDKIRERIENESQL